MMKLEDGELSVTTQKSEEENVYEISDDDLPDLEETEVRNDWIKGEVVHKVVETNSPESPTPEDQCAEPLGLNREPRRVPLYEDLSSSEDNEPVFETISSDSEGKSPCFLLVDITTM